MPPDGPRERFVPVVSIAPRQEPDHGFTAANTSGLGPRELAALNRALDRMVAAGLEEYEAKVKIDHAVRAWLVPAHADDADLEQLLKGHEGGS